MADRVVEVAPWATAQRRAHTIGSVRGRARAGVVAGIVCGLVALLGIVAAFVESEFQLAFGGLFLAVIAAALLWSGRHRLLAARGRADDEEVFFVAPYAFVVTDATLEFPEVLGRPAESWDRESTSSEVATVAKQDMLVLTHPQFRTRRFAARALKETPSQVLAAIRAV